MQVAVKSSRIGYERREDLVGDGHGDLREGLLEGEAKRLGTVDDCEIARSESGVTAPLAGGAAIRQRQIQEEHLSRIPFDELGLRLTSWGGETIRDTARAPTDRPVTVPKKPPPSASRRSTATGTKASETRSAHAGNCS